MSTLSVISPVYNEESSILPFLESLQAQTWPDFELVIVDDGSTDRTVEMIESYLPRLRCRTLFVQHERNLGELATVTEAFSEATGDICLKLDADSRLEADTLERILESFDDEQVGAATTLFGALDHSNWLLRGAEVLVVAQQRCDQERGGYTTTAYGTCFAFRRHLLSPAEIASRRDIDLSQLLRKRGWKIALIEDVVVRTRFPATLATTFARGRRMAWEELAAHWNHKEMLLWHWGFWAKLAPLGLAMVAPFRPRWALAGLAAWLAGAQVFLARRVPDYPLADRVAAWGVTAVRWSGFDLEVLRMAAQAAAGRLKAAAARGRGQ
jgi:glycosyltransferase involved in cell wall biosynthesis